MAVTLERVSQGNPWAEWREDKKCLGFNARRKGFSPGGTVRS
jgi:hypothetical protein